MWSEYQKMKNLFHHNITEGFLVTYLFLIFLYTNDDCVNTETIDVSVLTMHLHLQLVKQSMRLLLLVHIIKY